MKVISVPLQLKRLKEDPLGTIIDRIIALVAGILIPIPLSGEVIAQLKKPLLGFILTLIIFMFMALVVTGAAVILPLVIGTRAITGQANQYDLGNLSIPVDTSFGDTSVPRKNPFGGNGLDYSNITSYFLDPSYYLRFGKPHPAIDMVPSDEYYKKSEVFKNTGLVVVYSSISGTVNHYVDSNGGETVEITNLDNSFKVVYIHFKESLVNSGSLIKSGSPVGIMGDTGFSTGDHVHYEVRIKDGDTWKAVNPLNYIQ